MRWLTSCCRQDDQASPMVLDQFAHAARLIYRFEKAAQSVVGRYYRLLGIDGLMVLDVREQGQKREEGYSKAQC